MLSFLSSCSICTALTKEPSAMYVKYLKDFWYTTEVDDATKDISFSLSLFENQLSFNCFDFLTTIGLTDSKSVVPLPPKGTVKAVLATLGLADKDKPSLTSTELVNSSPLKLNQQTIAYCLICGLEINIGDIIFKDLINKLHDGKKNREANVCYTRYISLVLEQLLGENYNDEFFTVLKPHHILAASFQTPSASEVSLTSHMLKVAKLSKEPNESLILPFEEVNAEMTVDMSQSGTNVQPLSQPKAPTANKSKKKIIPSLTQPKSLEASVMAEVQVNQLKAADTTEVPKKIIEKEEVTEGQTQEIPTQLDEVNKAAQETPQSPYDIESAIKVVKSFFTSHLSKVQDQTMNYYEESTTADSDDTNDNEVSHSAHTSHGITFAKRLSIPDHMHHICEEVSYLHSRLGNMESSIVQVVGLEGVREDLQSQTKHISKYSSSFQDMHTQLRDVKDLLELAGEQKTAENITPPEPSPEIQGELAYKELTLPVFETKVNEESAMVLYNPDKDLVDLTNTEQNLEDDDDLDK
ncbi:hypothetical protein Tco_0565127 [Tanacetum coccineum]